VVLLTINDKSIGRPAALNQDFKAAVSFLPRRLQRHPAIKTLDRGRAARLDHAAAAAGAVR
jgi:hypothetical protein